MPCSRRCSAIGQTRIKYFLQWLLVRQYKVSGRFTVLLDASRADMDAARGSGYMRSVHNVRYFFVI